MIKKSSAAKSSKKIKSKENRSRMSDINLMLSAHSREFLKDMKVVLPPRLRSMLRHRLARLSEDMQLFVCDNVLTYLRTGFMFSSGVELVDECQGLLVLEIMNAPDINYPPF